MVPIFQSKWRHTTENHFHRHESFNTQTGSGFEKYFGFLIEHTFIESASTRGDMGTTRGDMGINGAPF